MWAAATSSSASFARTHTAAHSSRRPPKYAYTRPPYWRSQQRHHKSDALPGDGYATARAHANAQPSTAVHTTNPPNQHVVKHAHATIERACTCKTDQGGFTSDRLTTETPGRCLEEGQLAKGERGRQEVRGRGNPTHEWRQTRTRNVGVMGSSNVHTFRPGGSIRANRLS